MSEFVWRRRQQEGSAARRQAICSRCGRQAMSASTAGTSVFPLPAVASPPRPRSSSRRVWQRYRAAAARVKLVNFLIAALNVLFVSMASSYVPPASLSALARDLFAHRDTDIYHDYSVLFSHIDYSFLISDIHHMHNRHPYLHKENTRQASHRAHEPPAFVSAAKSRVVAHLFGCVARFCRRRDAVSAAARDLTNTSLLSPRTIA